MAGLSIALQQQVMHRFGQVPPPMGDPPVAPATPAEIEASEQRLGFVLPTAVRNLYELANGGAGFLGLIGGQADDLGSNAVDLYESFMQSDDDPDAPEPWQWRARVLPIFYWGCNTYSCVDCANEDSDVIGRDGFRWVPDGRPFATWLEHWATDRREQPGADRPPDTDA